jgi:hypothetical protein
MSFALLNQKFKTNMFVIYCDEKDKKKKEVIMRNMVKARK